MRTRTPHVLTVVWFPKTTLTLQLRRGLLLLERFVLRHPVLRGNRGREMRHRYIEQLEHAEVGVVGPLALETVFHFSSKKPLCQTNIVHRTGATSKSRAAQVR